MNVSQQNIDKVSAVIKIEITKADYKKKLTKLYALIVRKQIFRDFVEVWFQWG